MSARAMGSHQSAAAKSIVWLTPPAVLHALGPFDLDPCAVSPPRPWSTAGAHFTVEDDGLAREWFGRVWLNPPYSEPVMSQFMQRLADHDRGTALVFARTETAAFFRNIWRRASGLLFLEGRLHFHRPDGTRAPANSGAPSVLAAYGEEDLEVLATCSLAGHLVPLRLPRSIITAALEPTWREVVGAWLEEQNGPVEVAAIYQALARHPKVRGRAHWREKIRQTLQRGAGERVAPGVWAAP
jgi:hypothetical protein